MTSHRPTSEIAVAEGGATAGQTVKAGAGASRWPKRIPPLTAEQKRIILEVLDPYFVVEHRSFYPIPLPFIFCNLVIGITCRPRPKVTQ
jgi:hypothetical protein